MQAQLEMAYEERKFLDPINVKKRLEDHSYDILGARMLWKPKEARIL